VLRHLFPALRSRQQFQPVGEVAQAEVIERRAILRRRGIERDAGARVADLGDQLRLVGRGGDARIMKTAPRIGARASSPMPATVRGIVR